MKRILRFVFVAAGLVLAAGSHRDLRAQQREPTVTKLYTKSDGLAYFEKIDIPYQQLIRLAGGAMFSRSKPSAPNAPAPFHNAPHRRYIITLSGTAEITASGGEKFICDRDHILIVEDLTGKGHSTRYPGPEDWIRVFLEVDEPRARQR